jgi:hypothetical protein
MQEPIKNLRTKCYSYIVLSRQTSGTATAVFMKTAVALLAAANSLCICTIQRALVYCVTDIPYIMYIVTLLKLRASTCARSSNTHV